MLTSRSGVKTGYQAHCVARWQSQGVEVIISKRDVCQEMEAKTLIEEALKSGPVGGIFNLAMVSYPTQMQMMSQKFRFF